MTDYDVLIVGSGAAGGMAAYTLTQRGAKCLMLEAGPSDTVRTFERRATYVFEELAHDLRFEMLARRPEMYPPGYSIHEIGTCRMGDDPRKSVLNRWNQSHDVPNLFVVDGSSFVSGGYQNPTMTILALSMRASEHIAEQVARREL